MKKPIKFLTKANPLTRIIFLPACTLILALFFIVPQKIFAENGITFLGDQAIVLVDGTKLSGSTMIWLKNDSKKSVHLLLNAKNIISTITNNTVMGEVQFKAKGGDQFLQVIEVNILANNTIGIEIEVTDYSEAGESYVRICNNQDSLTAIRIINRSYPFNISLDSGNPNAPEIVFRRNDSIMIVLKNEDKMGYKVHCSIYIPDLELYQEVSDVFCPANSSKNIRFSIGKDIFKSFIPGIFKDYEKDGQLILRSLPSITVDYAVPVKIIPVKIKVQSYTESKKYIWSNVIIFIALLMGGILSVILHIFIPNKSKSLELKKRLNELLTKIRAFSTKIDSELRVGIRVERIRLLDKVNAVWSIKPDSLLILDGIIAEIDILAKRIDITQKLDIVSVLFEDKKDQTHEAPAKRMDEIRKFIDDATINLKLNNPGENDLNNANAKIKSANEKLENLVADENTFAEELSKDIVKLVGIYAELEKGSKKYQEMKVKLINLFCLLKSHNVLKYQNSANIKPEHYHWLSSSIERLKVLSEYINTWENYSERQSNMFDLEKTFLLDLNYRTWSSLLHARQFRLQFEANVFASQIHETLEKDGCDVMYYPTELPRPNQRIDMEILLKNTDLNRSYAKYAKNEFNCVWDFNKIGIEKGWKISHYFRNKKETKYTIRFYDSKGIQIKINGHDSIEKNDVNLLKKDSRVYGAGLEIVKFIFAFAVALIALFAGAKEQILKLDVASGLIAVFLLGFGADAIKNYLTKSPK